MNVAQTIMKHNSIHIPDETAAYSIDIMSWTAKGNSIIEASKNIHLVIVIGLYFKINGLKTTIYMEEHKQLSNANMAPIGLVPTSTGILPELTTNRYMPNIPNKMPTICHIDTLIFNMIAARLRVKSGFNVAIIDESNGVEYTID